MATESQEPINRLATSVKGHFESIREGDLVPTSLRDLALREAADLSTDELMMLAITGLRERWSGDLFVQHKVTEATSAHLVIASLVAAKAVAIILEDLQWVSRWVRQDGGAVGTNGIFEITELIPAKDILSSPIG